MSEPRKPKTAPRVVHAHAEFVVAPVAPKRHRTRWILGDPDADAVEAEVSEHVRKRRGEDAKPTAERKAKDVERFELLAKAVAKVPEVRPRKIYVDKRDGSIGEITLRDVNDKMLEREAIASETVAGVRPKVVLCAVCKCVVEVPKRGGRVPRTCAKHSKNRLCPRGCGATVYRKTQCCSACKTPDERLNAMRKRGDAIRKAKAAKTTEQRSSSARRANAARTPEERSECARKRNATRTIDQRSESARKAAASLTPEQRSERLRKAWETRRAKAAAEKAGEQ